MLAALLATTILLIAVSLLNFILTMGVIRQLRTHAEVLRKSATPDRPGVVGRRVAEFSVTTVRGDTLSRERLRAYTLVAFYLPGCAGCEEQLPALLSYVDAGRHGDSTVVAVVAGDGPARAEAEAALRTAVDVVAADGTAELIRAFGNSAYPAFYLVDREGWVLQSSFDIAAIAAPRSPSEVG